MLTLVASALAGGDCIDDADALRAGGTVGVLGCVVKAPSTLGTFLRSFRWGHVRQLDRVSRQLLAPGLGRWGRTRRLAPDHRPGLDHLRDLWTGQGGSAPPRLYRQAGYHPLLAIAAGTGEVLMSRLREGRANTARGAAHFLRGTVGRVRYAGANGLLTLRADKRLLRPHCRCRLPGNGCPLLHHHPPAQKPAEPDRGDSRCRLDAGPLLDGRRRRCGGDHLHPLPD